ncbi:hypothetical protein FVQ98_14200 [Ottowia sp. GY511]|uniref:Uncharacterized protein n=1 Tax=Ottowia flava TaxID=2675430 RepID=A0ABW4KP77_9BURK|nr:hypothetical protein [Ottowia sp. GY511]TXK26524.1 hypothetical protein FVQ98_14200 [Ottowia sp. GY511]
MRKTCLKCSHLNLEATGSIGEQCPKCGAIYAKVDRYVAEHGVLAVQRRPTGAAKAQPVQQEVASEETPAQGKKRTRPVVKALAVFFALVLFIVFYGEATKGPAPAQSPADTQAAGALLHCQTAIRRASRNAQRAVVPSVPQSFPLDADQYGFEWKSGSGLQLQNGFGAMLDTYATCVVSKRDLEIDWLEIGSETVVRRAK